MFTGIITDIGTIRAIEGDADKRFSIQTAYDMDSVGIGASIACSGVCLTVVAKGADFFTVDVSRETLSCTVLGGWEIGTPVNLERALKVGDELGGHIVTGHVDGVGTVLERRPDGDSIRLTISLPGALSRYVARKGSVTVDGVSLTVNGAGDSDFDVNIIPHTAAHTTLGALAEGDEVNLEIDVLARYVERMQQMEK